MAADRWWETSGQKTARLTGRDLRRGAGLLAAQGWTPEPVVQRRRGFWVTFLDAEDGQLIVSLDPGPWTPEAQAAEMTGFLLSAPACPRVPGELIPPRPAHHPAVRQQPRGI